MVLLDSHCQVEYQNAKYFRKETNQNWKGKNIKDEKISKIAAASKIQSQKCKSFIIMKI